MRLIAWLLLALAFFQGFYSVAVALSSYFAVSDVVDQAVADHGRGGPAVVRDAVLRGVARAGVEVDDRQITVTQENRTLDVQVKWSYPVITLRGDPVLVIPISLERHFAR